MQRTWIRATSQRPVARRPARPRAEGWFAADKPAAPDVLYRNPPAIASRLRLFHLLRLQAQERFDADTLRSAATAAAQSPTGHNDGAGPLSSSAELHPAQTDTKSQKCAAVSFQWSSGVPGAGREYNPVRSARVRLSVPTAYMGLSPEETDALVRIAASAGHPVQDAHNQNLTSDMSQSMSKQKDTPPSTVLSYTVESYPFVRQNAREAFDILRNLVLHAKDLAGKLPAEPASEPAAATQALTRARVAPMRWMPNPSMRFPSAWLEKRSASVVPRTTSNNSRAPEPESAVDQ